MDTSKIPTSPVSSSNIAELGYDAETKTLIVVFHNGRKYSFADVPEELNDELVNAKSIGGFFASAIKPFFKGNQF
jgi:hypothetical protein